MMRRRLRALSTCVALVAVTVLVVRMAPMVAASSHGTEVSRDPSPMSVHGVKLGMSRQQIEARLGPGRKAASQPGAVSYRDVLVRYDNGTAVFVAGRKLERNGDVILAANASVADGERALGAAKIDGYLSTLKGKLPAVRYAQSPVTVVLVPGTATISSVSLTHDDGVFSSRNGR